MNFSITASLIPIAIFVMAKDKSPVYTKNRGDDHV